jgi:hypothetical protein
VTRPAIRDATPADATAISGLVCRVAGDTIFADGPEDGRRYFMAMNAPAATAGKLNDSAYRYHVAEQDGRIVGMVAIRGNAHVYHLFVDTSMHGGNTLARCAAGTGTTDATPWMPRRTRWASTSDSASRCRAHSASATVTRPCP